MKRLSNDVSVGLFTLLFLICVALPCRGKDQLLRRGERVLWTLSDTQYSHCLTVCMPVSQAMRALLSILSLVSLPLCLNSQGVSFADNQYYLIFSGMITRYHRFNAIIYLSIYLIRQGTALPREIHTDGPFTNLYI